MPVLTGGWRGRQVTHRLTLRVTWQARPDLLPPGDWRDAQHWSHRHTRHQSQGSSRPHNLPQSLLSPLQTSDTSPRPVTTYQHTEFVGIFSYEKKNILHEMWKKTWLKCFVIVFLHLFNSVHLFKPLSTILYITERNNFNFFAGRRFQS